MYAFTILESSFYIRKILARVENWPSPMFMGDENPAQPDKLARGLLAKIARHDRVKFEGKIKLWRVLVVEDDANTRDFFANSVLDCDQLQLAASYGTVSEANAWLDRNAASVDVLLTDLGLPDGSGLDVIRHVMKLNPECEALVISMFGDEANVLASIEAGALGYILKDSTPRNIAQTILQMRAGASPISPMIARRVLEKYKSDKIGREIVRLDSVPIGGPLSPREQQVLTFISQGLSYAEIAHSQNVSVHTVQTHIKNLYRKLSVNSRGEAVYKAQGLGLLKVQ